MECYLERQIAATDRAIEARLGRRAATECPECGRRLTERLTVAEAHAAYGYGSTTCTACYLTDHFRPVSHAHADQR
jgi:hypothetical protein